MNFLGVGPAELLIILIVALLVFGPTKLPQVARDLGQAIGKWRQALDEIQSVTDAPLKEMKEIKQALDPASVEKKLQESVQQIISPEPPGQRSDADDAAAEKSAEKRPEVEKLQESAQQSLSPESPAQRTDADQAATEKSDERQPEVENQCQT